MLASQLSADVAALGLELPGQPVVDAASTHTLVAFADDSAGQVTLLIYDDSALPERASDPGRSYRPLTPTRYHSPDWVW